MPDLTKVKNPFNEVSVYPPILPYVGQADAHDRLKEFIAEMNQGQESVFCAIFGDWAIGKSRLAHELISEVYGENRGWLLKDSPIGDNRLLKQISLMGALPLFIPYVKVLNFETFGINSADVLGKIATTAFLQMAEPAGLNKTQMDVIERVRNIILSINPDFDFSWLSLTAQDRDENYISRANKLFRILKENTSIDGKSPINKIMILVDEVESAGEINPFSVQGQDRGVSDYPVPLRSIRDLTEAIKSESRMTTYPDISFIFFNSLTVKRHTRLDPLERRQIEVDLLKATSDDFNLLMDALKSTGYPVDDLILKLAQTAFFAADRNIGWFFYIMRRVHKTLQERPELVSPSEIFQQVHRATGKIFQPRHIEDRNISEPIKEYMRRVVYHQMPASPIELNIPSGAVASLTDYKDPFSTRFVGEVFVTSIDADTLTTELLNTKKYSAEQKPKLVGEGSPPFDPAALLNQIRTFAWHNTNEWWAYSDLSEFERQLAFAFGGVLTYRTAETIHNIIKSAPYRQPQPSVLLAPTMSFLLRFNELWGRLASPNWLPEQQWEAMLRKIDDTPAENQARLLLGIAKLLNDKVDIIEKRIEANRRQIILKVDERDLLNMNPDRKVAILKAGDPRQTIENLREIKGMPIILVFDSRGSQEVWEKFLEETHQSQLAVPVIPRVVQPDTREYEFCIRYSFRDEPDGFKPSDITLQGKQEREEFKSYWGEDIQHWIANLDQQGYIFRPFIASMVGFNKFLKAYPLLVEGKTREHLQTMDEGAAMIQGMNDVRTVQGSDTLRMLDDRNIVVFPNTFPRILSLLEQPRKLTELEKELFYVRSSRTDVSFPSTGAQVLEQILKLLISVGLVEFNNDEKKYEAITEQRLGRELDIAIQQLGAFDPPYSNYAEKVVNLPSVLHQLAATCRVNLDMLLELKVSLIVPEQAAVTNLRMIRLKTIPVDQAAFFQVASKINDVRNAARRVINKSLDTPPDIDPETLPTRINEISIDKDYLKYSVEYRIKFLDKVAKAFEDIRQKVQKSIDDHRNVIRSGGKYRLNDDGSQFPTSPITWLLDQVEKDLKQEIDTTLPVNLKQNDTDLPLKNRIGAGAIAIVIKKLQWYFEQFSDTNPDGWWSSFTHSYDLWQSALQKHRDMDSRWKDVLNYFAGTAEEHRLRFVSSSLEQDKKRASLQVASFATTIQELSEPTIQDILSEIESISKKIAEIKDASETSLAQGQAEIVELTKHTDYDAISCLSNRMGKALSIESPDQITRLKTHQQQHKRLDEYNLSVLKIGNELCGHEGLYQQYLRLRHAIQDDKDIAAEFEMSVLEEMEKRNMIGLKKVVEINL